MPNLHSGMQHHAKIHTESRIHHCCVLAAGASLVHSALQKRLIQEISVPEVTAAPQQGSAAAAEPEKKKKKKKQKAAEPDGDAEALAATDALLADVLAPQEAAMQQQNLQPESAADGTKKKQKKKKEANGLAAVAGATAVDAEAAAPKKVWDSSCPWHVSCSCRCKL